MTSDNSLREGRTAVKPIDFFDRKVPLTSENGVENNKNMYFQKKMQKVNGGQKSHTGSPGVDRYADYNGLTSNPNGRLVFELSPKNRFLTPN